ncbi:MAG TPA: glycoside hydrolase domain-containing protein [Streptosporangiaceae bacterium]|nr:glycoside hydrolase domain-containing protein [Streptosporangiaceae bacterium]
MRPQGRGPRRSTRALAAALLIIAGGLLVGCRPRVVATRPPSGSTGYTRFVDNNQGPGDVFMRYPLGRIGLWSTPEGEIADSVTRGLQLYPTVDQVVDKGTADWRASVGASPSQTNITYSTSVAAKGSTVALTVTPDVSVYRYHFSNATSYEAVDLLIQEVENSDVIWSSSKFVYVDSQTAEVTLSNGGSQQCYFYVRFSTPAASHGTFTSRGVTGGATSITGDNIGGYLRFAPRTPVTVAVALSMTSMSRAQRNFTNEFPTFDFARAVQALNNAWNAKLGKIDVQSASTLTTREIYTGLYSLYANIIDVTDNGSGYKPVSPSTRLLTIGSSIWWERVGGGYFRCSFDQGRNVYAFLTLLDPALMTDVLNTYLSQYNHDGYLKGNWDPYTPDAWSDQQWGFFSYYFLAAKLEGVTGVDYKAAETAILKTMGMNATNMYLVKAGFYRYGYVPANIGTSNYLSRGLEFSTQLQGLAHLGYVLGDSATYHTYYPWGTAYLHTWNAARKIFQARNTDGSWAPVNAGLFEGTTTNYAFDEPSAGLGLADIYGDAAMSSKITSIYAAPNIWYNDYQLVQPYLAISANSPSVSQNVIRNYFLPEFSSLNMWEQLPGGGSLYYTDNASAEVLANLGIYPIQSPGAQWILNSPAVTRAVIHGRSDIVIQAPHNSAATPYVSSIRVNGSAYPSHFISGETLATHSNTLAFGMTDAPSRIGRMYVTGTYGEVLSASTDNSTYLQFRNDPLGGTSRAEVYSVRAPAGVSVNGKALPGSNWSDNSGAHVIVLNGLPAGPVLVRFRRA